MEGWEGSGRESLIASGFPLPLPLKEEDLPLPRPGFSCEEEAAGWLVRWGLMPVEDLGNILALDMVLSLCFAAPFVFGGGAGIRKEPAASKVLTSDHVWSDIRPSVKMSEVMILARIYPGAF